MQQVACEGMETISMEPSHAPDQTAALMLMSVVCSACFEILSSATVQHLPLADIQQISLYIFGEGCHFKQANAGDV